MAFEPDNFQQMAGLVSYYNAHKFHYLYISYDEKIGKHLAVMSCLGDQSWTAHFPLKDRLIALPEHSAVYLRATVAFQSLRFQWSLDDKQWQDIPLELDQSLISDETGKGDGASFTGAFIGMCCQDISGTGKAADFDFFDYAEDSAQ